MRVSAFDLGVKGAVFRSELTEDGSILPLSCEKWSLKGTDDERYYALQQIARVECEWADAIGYEHFQGHARSKNLIEGFRALILAECIERDLLCAGVNVSTLKKFAIAGRWTDRDRKAMGKKPIDAKKKMAMALMFDYPEFTEYMDGTDERRVVPITGKRDDLIDAAWVSIWLLINAEVL